MAETKNEGLMEKIVSLCKRRGFVFPGSEIYGGMANSWDYGPLGVELKNNIKQAWWNRFVHRRDDVVGIDAALIMNSKVWEVSGHLANFTDPLVECKKCHNRFRVDLLSIDQNDLVVFRKEFQNKISDMLHSVDRSLDDFDLLNSAFSKILGKHDAAELDKNEKENLEVALRQILKVMEEKNKDAKENFGFASFLEGEVRESERYSGLVTQIYLNKLVRCPICGEHQWEIPRQFNLMFKTFIGSAENETNIAYFRPETAQAMFVDFKNVLDTTRRTLPFGIAQTGKAFRNEITPGNFIFRTREFEQMEIEYFIREEDWEKVFEDWRKEMHSWMTDVLGLNPSSVHELEVPDGERAHYSKRTIDFEFDFPFGKKELYGLAYRGDFDLHNHFKEEAPYKDQKTGEAFWPHVIEPTWGVDRSVLAVLSNSYTEEGDRVVLKLPARLAPYKAAVFPLLANKPELVAKAREIYDMLKKDFMIAWDDRGNIGKRYYAQDEIGTPYCITVDFDTIEKDAGVTVRDRDTATQERMPISELAEFLRKAMKSQ